MKYEYIVGLLVALSFNNGFAADIANNAHQEIYEAFTRGGSENINAALKNNPNFDHNADPDAIRSSVTGLALRKAVIGLNAAELQSVVEANQANLDFFKTSLGVSLLYGWALNQYADPRTPYYIGRYFSFDKMFQGLADRASDDANVKTFLKSTFTLGLAAVEADRWAFYDHMVYLPYAIEKVRAAVVVDADADAAPTMAMVIAGARRSADEARTEAANLMPAKAGRTVHLDVVASPAAVNSLNCTDVSMVQRCLLQRPQLFNFGEKDAAIKETLLSLPAATPDTYQFMGRTVAQYLSVAQSATIQTRGVIAKQAARSIPSFFTTNRLATIDRIIKEIENKDNFVSTEALKDAFAIIRNPSFLENDQFLNPASFPSYMVTTDTTVGLDAHLVKVLALHAKGQHDDFMSGNSNYGTVTSYGDNQSLKGIYNWRPERARIVAVRNALRRFHTLA